MGIVSTIPEKCRRCYTCVRECPVKAIKVMAGQATVIAEQCIACGNCVKVCTQKAKRIEDSSMLVAPDAGRRRAGRLRAWPLRSPLRSRRSSRGGLSRLCAPWGFPRCGRWRSARS